MKTIFICIIFLVINFSTNCQQFIENEFMEAYSQKGLKNPGVSFPRFDLIANNQISYSQDSLLNKITVINFWFESCAPCIAELQPLNNLYQKFKRDTTFSFLSFSCDQKDLINNFVRKHSIQYPVLQVNSPDIYKYNFKRGFPTTLIIDRKGVVRYMKCGGETDSVKAAKTIETLYYKEIEELLNEK